MKHENLEKYLFTTGAGRVAEFENAGPSSSVSFQFRVAKRSFDIVVAVLLTPILLFAAVALSIVNPFLNPGPLFFVQERMGEGTAPFAALKFRSMAAAGDKERGATDPLEVDRISRLGHFIRKSRIDELPQIINVLRGEMSLIGPRPDFYPHAVEYLGTVPGYRARHAVRPGISGYAQTEVGYADNMDAVAAKVAADLYYIRNRRLRLEAWIFWRTLVTVFGRKGA